jgi:hypothetical protein
MPARGFSTITISWKVHLPCRINANFSGNGENYYDFLPPEGVMSSHLALASSDQADLLEDSHHARCA